MTLRHSPRLLIAPLLTGALAFAGSAFAQITQLCGPADNCTANRTVTAGTDAVVPLVWRGSAMVEIPDRVQSDGGLFMIGDPLKGQVLGTSRQPLSQPVQGTPDGAPVPLRINESLQVPAAISQRAADAGASQLYFTRAFTLYGITINAAQTIPLRVREPLPVGEVPISQGSEPVATAVAIERVALRFDSGALVETVARNGHLRAVATVNYQRAGMLSALWEVATPASGNQLVFRPLENVRRYLGAGNQVQIQSPALPTRLNGVYSVHLRLLRPTINQEPVILRYQVSERTLTEQEPTPLPVSQPARGQTLDGDTRFAWQVQPGARAYRIELYDTPPTIKNERAIPVGEPLTGLLAEGDQSGARLSAAVLSWLQPGQTYYWRVVAIDADGGIMSASPLREIQAE